MKTLGKKWDCSCGQKGIVGNFCNNCGLNRNEVKNPKWENFYSSEPKPKSTNKFKILILVNVLVVICILLFLVWFLSISRQEKSSNMNENEKKDEVAVRVEQEIASIGEVTIDDEEIINHAYEIYCTLTDSQKSQVNNYNDLLDAQDKLKVLKEDITQNKEKKVAEDIIRKKLIETSNSIIRESNAREAFNGVVHINLITKETIFYWQEIGMTYYIYSYSSKTCKKEEITHSSSFNESLLECIHHADDYYELINGIFFDTNNIETASRAYIIVNQQDIEEIFA